jgi:hypothetical protein
MLLSDGTGVILSGLSHPDMQDENGWAVYYTNKGVHKERRALDHLNAQVGCSWGSGERAECSCTGWRPRRLTHAAGVMV